MLEDRQVDMPDSRLRNAALYIRVVCENNDAVEKQETMLLKYAEKHGYKNAMLYVDNGVSGCTMDRPAFGRLNTDIVAGKVGRVIVRDLSRIGRNFFDVFDWLYGLREHGIAILSVNDGIDL